MVKGSREGGKKGKREGWGLREVGYENEAGT